MNAGGRSLGGYEVLYALKTGGMGEVLLARRRGPRGFEQLVAIKTIRGELRQSLELRSMFFDEAQLLARLDHPGIARIYDFGEDGDTMYLAMEYVAGVRFRELTRARVPAAVACRLMASACRGLHAAHELSDLSGQPMGVVHRDVSPENLMLTYGGQVKVLDFGIALMRGRQAPVTELGTIKGKPPYLAPEQVKNQALDRRTDVFAACAVLHELLTGTQLFDGDSVYAVARAIEHAEVPPPSRSAGPLPEELDALVLRGLERDPARRVPTALELATGLERIAEQAGGERLESYAATALAEQRAHHDRWLRGLLAAVGSGLTPQAQRARPSGVVTAQAEAADGDPSGAPPVSRAPRPARWPWLLAMAAALVAAVLAIALLRADDPAVAMAAADAGVAPIDAAATTTMAAPALDAAQLAPPDAGPPDARRPAVVRSKPDSRPRRPADAGAAIARASPPDASPVRPTGFATLTVAAEPYAIVQLDGSDIGATPIIGRRIPAGPHTVVLVHPDSGQVRHRQSIDLAAGEHQDIKLLR